MHILANRWVNGPHYEGEAGVEKLRAAVRSVRGDVHALAYHHKLRSPVKAAIRRLADELGLAVINHRHLRAGNLRTADASEVVRENAD